MTDLSSKLVESVARALCPEEPNGTDRRTGDDGTHYPAGSPHWEVWKDGAREVLNIAFTTMLAEGPREGMWLGLARDIIMWMDMYDGSSKTPRNLFEHLERIGRPAPQWLKDEPELTALDHVPSKGTRAVIIFRAMLIALIAEVSQ